MIICLSYKKDIKNADTNFANRFVKFYIITDVVLVNKEVTDILIRSLSYIIAFARFAVKVGAAEPNWDDVGGSGS